MSNIKGGLPSWARTRIEGFIHQKSDPIGSGHAAPVSLNEGKAHRAVIDQTAAELIAYDNGDDDKDRRPGYVSTELQGTGMPIEYRFEQDGDRVELAYSFAEGHLALYLCSDQEKSVMVDMTSSGGEHDLAVFIDHGDPSGSVLYTA